MFKNLPPSIRFENKRVRFRNEIDWSINHLKKDDRIVWYLSILQRFSMHYLKISNKFSDFEKNHKIGAKIKRKLRGWDIQRVQKDFELFNHETWEHFSNIQMVFGSFKMQHYAFYNKKKNKLEPKSVQEVFDAFRKMESDLQNDNKRDRYCSDGKPVLTFDDGWTWFGISEGFSAQEAAAMRHCGNGEGGRGDYLLSLRQPIEKQGVIFWKPHLTFILNNGYLGEMKGFANQKPHSRYHGYIENLLTHKIIKGISGGGYLPQNNFSFDDLDQKVKIRILEKKPLLEFDPVGQGGEMKLEIPGCGAWYEFSDKSFPDSAACFINEWSTKNSQWLVFQSYFSTSSSTFRSSGIWGFLEKGRLSKLHFGKLKPPRDALIKLLYSPFVEFLSEDLLNPDSDLTKMIGRDEVNELISQKPGFFINTSLTQLYDRVGNSEALVKNLNHRFGSDFKLSTGGISLARYESPEEFASFTGVWVRCQGKCGPWAIQKNGL